MGEQEDQEAHEIEVLRALHVARYRATSTHKELLDAVQAEAALRKACANHRKDIRTEPPANLVRELLAASARVGTLQLITYDAKRRLEEAEARLDALPPPV